MSRVRPAGRVDGDTERVSKYLVFARSKLGVAAKDVFIVAIYIVVTMSIMMAFEGQGNEDVGDNWTWIDAAYFTVTIMSTVGYGDFSPSSPGSRVFVLCAIFVGIVFVFVRVASGISMLTKPLAKKGRGLLEYLFPQVPIDLDGKGADLYKPRHPIIYYSKNLLPSFLLAVFTQCVSAAIFVAVEGWSYGEGIYHCLITATTVGFGDIYIATQGGRLFAFFQILFSVALVGDAISTIDELREERSKTMARIHMLTTRLTSANLKNLLAHAVELRPEFERDGRGLTELEFAMGMMLELGVVDFDQVRPFIQQYAAQVLAWPMDPKRS